MGTNTRGGQSLGFGSFVKTKRLQAGETLRQFCKSNGFDPGNFSKIERGILPPPTSREKLNRYAEALRLKEGTDDWIEFFDLAAAYSGKIPDDIMDNAEVLDKLPVFFRTIRGQQVSPEKLEALVKLIKET